MAHRDDPRDRYEKEKERLKLVADGGSGETDGPGQLRGDISTVDAEKIQAVLDALDDEHPAELFQANGNGTETLEAKTLSNYAARLRLAATEIDGDLLERSTDSINQLMADMASGTAEIAPDDGYSKGTVGQYQSALKAFYRYHDGHDVDPESIPVFAPEQSSVDERDMFTVDEVEAMRDAINAPRERCLFELLAFTGQRIRVIQTLRLKDVDLAEGVFYLNEDVEGLKGAQGKRPLLGAEAYVRRWLDYHPTPDDPSAFLITPVPEHGGGGEPGGMLTQDAIRYQLRKIADEAGVEKDVHPHIFRHYFTTIAKRDYNMDDAYIKHLRGDAPGSRVMETTYRHLSDGDAVEHAAAKFEGREIEQESPLTPATCSTCGEILEENAKACGTCGAVYTPDAKQAEDQIQEGMKQSYRETPPGDTDTMEKLDTLDELLEDPEVRAALVEKIGAEE
jgi:integrase